MTGVLDDSFDLVGLPEDCSPITQAELEDAESFGAMVESTPVKLVAPIIEDREGLARTSVKQITGDGPVVFSSETFSMHRLLWVDGVMQADNKGTTKATFAVFKMNLESHTKSSGAGKDKAVRSARVQVEFHGAGKDADTFGAQRPVVVGWAPFATMERPNETTAQHTRDRSLRAILRGGMMQAGGALEASASDTRAWQRRYFDEYRSQPVSVLGSNGESSEYNGVVWTMKQNSLAREGVVPELLVYMLVTRQDDREYAVKITANVHTAQFRGHKEHKCVMRVTPQKPSRTKPTVCRLEGQKMWTLLDVDHLEALLSPAMDASLVLPWDMDAPAGTMDSKSGADSTNTTAGAETEAGKSEGQGGGGDDENAVCLSFDVAEAAESAQPAPDATLSVAVPLSPVERVPPVPKTGLDAATPLADKAVWDALLSFYESGDSHDSDDVEEDLATRMAMLETRLEVMEHRMARQALLIRALLKHKGR